MSDDDETDLKEQTAAELPSARWHRLTEEEGRARYDLLSITDDSVDYDDIFGGDPISFFVHRGDLAVPGPLVIGNDESRAVFVIEGSLEVAGALVVKHSGSPAPLWIRGNLVAGNLAVVMNAHLLVERNVTVAGELAVMLRDSGHFVVGGSLSTGTSIAASFDGVILLPDDSVEPLSGDELEARFSAEVLEIPNRPLAIALVASRGESLLR